MLISKKFDWCVNYNMEKVMVDVNDINKTLTIYDSTNIKKISHMKEVLDWLFEIEYTKKIFKYGKKIALMEWKAHSFLYNINVMPERTKHVDYNFKQSFFEIIGYFLVSLFYF